MSDAPEASDRLMLVGNPNVGKSVLFGLLTGTYAVVSNYPGTTVEVTRGKLRGLGAQPEVIDTPGINSLAPLSVDEVVTREMLLTNSGYAVLQVIDARNLARGLRITLELAELGLPVVIALNMMDEATIDGLEIDIPDLERVLGVEVVPTVAVERRGLHELRHAVQRTKPPLAATTFSEDIEEFLDRAVDLLPDLPFARRGVALLLLGSGDEDLVRLLADKIPSDVLCEIAELRCELQGRLSGPLDYAIARQRYQQAEELADSVTTRRRATPSRVREIVSAATMHPIWGIFIVLGVLLTLYGVVGKVGAGYVVDWMSGTVLGSPPDRLASMADASRPISTEVSSAAVMKAYGQGVMISPVKRRLPTVVTLSPGHGAIAMLGVGEKYTFVARISCDGPPPNARLAFTTVARSEQHPLTAVPTSPGSYSLYGQFSPAIDHAQYSAVLTFPRASRIRVLAFDVTREPRGHFIPWVYNLIDRHLPWAFGKYLLVGEYGLLTMGLTLALGIILPIVTFFFAFLALLEDSGYMIRLAVLTNRIFAALGLNGRAVVPMVLGLGCDTMATLAARVLETPKARVIVTFLLALGVPCSAQLGVVMAMAGSMGHAAILLIFGVVLIQLFAAGYVANKILPGARPDFLVEIPALRWPVLSNVVRKTLRRVEWFLREAVPVFLLSTAALSIAAWFGLLGFFERALQPVIVHLLGLPADATYPFLVGFLRRDYGAAGLFSLRAQGRLDNVQSVVALITMTLFVPCFANFMIMVKEQGAKRGLIIAGLVLIIAVLTGAAVNLILHTLGVTLGGG